MSLEDEADLEGVIEQIAALGAFPHDADDPLTHNSAHDICRLRDDDNS